LLRIAKILAISLRHVLMRQEYDAQLDRIERRDHAIDDRRFRTAHHARTEIDQVGCAVGVGGWIARAQQHDLRLLGGELGLSGPVRS
jgi:transcription antitermination factor NusA-like protein